MVVWSRGRDRKPNHARGPADPAVQPLFANAREVGRRLLAQGYQASDQTALAVCMADRTGRALLLEGATGVGKTDLAVTVAKAAGARLIRVQCYEGVDEADALYAWNHAKQILRLQTSSTSIPDIFAEEFLLERPLLAAIRGELPTVLLIDEIDKAQIEFDALLLEVLSDFSVTVAEFGTITATRRPLVIVTSGGQRELSDALRRRCHFLHLPNPDAAMERRILEHHVPDVDRRLTSAMRGLTAGHPWSDSLIATAKPSLVAYTIRFVDALRDNGLPCGPSGLVDAVRALLCIELSDRDQVREALSCTLVHREVQLPTFRALFELWFPDKVRPPKPDGPSEPSKVLAELDAGDRDPNQTLSDLAADLVSQFGEYQSLDGPSFSALQVVRAIDLDQTAEDVALDLADALPPSDLNSMIASRTARSRVEGLRRAIVAETNRRVAQRRGKERVAEYAVPKTTRADDSDEIDTSELAAVRRAVVELGRVLASREASQRRRARAGEIDMRRTMRKSMSTGGVPITLVRRRPRLSKPELIVLCDMSSSVSEWSYFTLILVDALRTAFSRVRIFAFIDTVDEVTDLFKPGTDLNAAIGRLRTEAAIEIDGRSNYGQTLANFESEYSNAGTAKTSMLVIGDARGNFYDPRVDVLRRLVATTNGAHWLNPEPRQRWGSGDSAAAEYSAAITMHECRNADQLSAVIAQLIDH
ncbi:VWA domain-containing protein [Antrihabitans stalactiti]|uniref:VWA domain-containing protein n=1 Tax=Antrihabitans stalactiti TaxID=2584121 RepID=A0A848KHL3_9NOCA|nr:VWA domain-containing protein [Antrihabitans stalactiti]